MNPYHRFREGLLAAALLAPAAATGHDDPRETVIQAFSQPMPNLPGKTLTSAVVRYAPGAKSPAHTHAHSAYVYAFVLDGAVRSQVDSGPIRVYRAGESWSELPGAHHRISENDSRTRPARLLAVFIADAGDAPLTTPDREGFRQ